MTGARTSPGSDGLLLGKDAFPKFVDSLLAEYRVAGPVMRRGQTVFDYVSSSAELHMDYISTMAPPSKLFFFKAEDELLSFRLGDAVIAEAVPPVVEKSVLVGIHPCDVNALRYLDRVFQDDPYYRSRRDGTIIIALNCGQVSEFCFCSSMDTGPHLKGTEGFDMLMTDMGEHFLVEPVSGRARAIAGAGWRKAGEGDFRKKEDREMLVLESFRRQIDVTGMDELFLRNLEHPVWQRTAEERCLSCTNCVMVCPTCFCHDVVDEVDMGLGQGRRFRRWDACQDAGFAEVHGGNFRHRRAARLRQFVMHKLNYSAQFGARGTVGCGRCIQWCPTGIDLTEMAKAIQREPR